MRYIIHRYPDLRSSYSAASDTWSEITSSSRSKPTGVRLKAITDLDPTGVKKPNERNHFLGSPALFNLKCNSSSQLYSLVRATPGFEKPNEMVHLEEPFPANTKQLPMVCTPWKSAVYLTSRGAWRMKIAQPPGTHRIPEWCGPIN